MSNRCVIWYCMYTWRHRRLVRASSVLHRRALFCKPISLCNFLVFFNGDIIAPPRLSRTRRNAECLAVGWQLHESLPGTLLCISRRGAAGPQLSSTTDTHTYTHDKTMRSWFRPKQHKLVLDVCVAHGNYPSKVEEENPQWSWMSTSDKTDVCVCVCVSDAHFRGVGVNHMSVTTGLPQLENMDFI